MVTRPPREDLLALKGTNLPVTGLLTLFGTRLRNHLTVPVIAEALRDAGLGTFPSFTTCGISETVSVIAADPIGIEDTDDDSGLTPGTLPQHSFKIGDIPSACGGVHSVASTAPVGDAIHTMRLKNFSQLPVIDGTSDLVGVLTWSSIATCYEKKKDLTLGNAMVRDDLPTAEVHQEVFAYLPQIRDNGYLLVRNNSGVILGIVTSADITDRFHFLAKPFFLLGEIEFRLRCCLGPKLNGAPVKAVSSKAKNGDVSELMFGDYVKLLRPDHANTTLRQNADSNWQALGWTGVNRAQFVHQLDQVRLIRNSIAHFDAAPPTPQQLADLTEFSALLKHLM